MEPVYTATAGPEFGRFSFATMGPYTKRPGDPFILILMVSIATILP